MLTACMLACEHAQTKIQSMLHVYIAIANQDMADKAVSFRVNCETINY